MTEKERKKGEKRLYNIGTLVMPVFIGLLFIFTTAIQQNEIEDLKDENFAVHKILNHDLEEVTKAQDENNKALEQSKPVENGLQDTFEKADPGGEFNAKK